MTNGSDQSKVLDEVYFTQRSSTSKEPKKKLSHFAPDISSQKAKPCTSEKGVMVCFGRHLDCGAGEGKLINDDDQDTAYH